MTPGIRSSCAALALSLLAAGPSVAAIVWDESINADLSNDGLNPTTLSVALGSNIVNGTTGDAGSGVDRDYFRFTIPVGALLTSITVQPNTTVSGSSSFIALQAGPQVTVTPSGTGVASLLGFSHYGSADIGNNLLPVLAASFLSGLPSGTYSLWLQETGGPVSYGIDFGVTAAAVPLPAAAWFMMAGLAGLFSRARRR
jgi:hypothetical protein